MSPTTNDLNRETRVQVGDRAPDFALPDQSKNLVHLADLLAKGPLVLYFYPSDNSAGCTTQACAFRDSYEAFQEAGATVVGVSVDSSESHEGFAQRHRLPFALLSDADGAVQQLYGVRKTLGIFRGRVTFVIDRQGIIRRRFSSQLNPTRHIAEALPVVQSLARATS